MIIITTLALVWVSESPSFLLPPLSLVASPCSMFMQARQSRAAGEPPCSGAQEFLCCYSVAHKAASLALHPHPSGDCSPSWGGWWWWYGSGEEGIADVWVRSPSNSHSSGGRMLWRMQLWDGEGCGGGKEVGGWKCFCRGFSSCSPIESVLPPHISSLCLQL